MASCQFADVTQGPFLPLFYHALPISYNAIWRYKGTVMFCLVMGFTYEKQVIHIQLSLIPNLIINALVTAV